MMPGGWRQKNRVANYTAVIPGREQRQLRVSPESVTTTGSTDSGPAPQAGRIPE